MKRINDRVVPGRDRRGGNAEYLVDNDSGEGDVFSVRRRGRSRRGYYVRYGIWRRRVVRSNRVCGLFVDRQFSRECRDKIHRNAEVGFVR